MEKLLDCGHPPTVTNDPMFPGVAHTWRGTTQCYACAEWLDRFSFDHAGLAREPYTCYVGRVEGKLCLTTFTGAKLADITFTSKIRLPQWSYIHGKSMLAITAKDRHGREWYGRGSEGIVCTVRRKGKVDQDKTDLLKAQRMLADEYERDVLNWMTRKVRTASELREQWDKE